MRLPQEAGVLSVILVCLVGCGSGGTNGAADASTTAGGRASTSQAGFAAVSTAARPTMTRDAAAAGGSTTTGATAVGGSTTIGAAAAGGSTTIGAAAAGGSTTTGGAAAGGSSTTTGATGGNVTSNGTDVAATGGAGTSSSAGTVLLDIPNRLQWANDGGYCGETSIQSIALYYGAWISQTVIRELAGGELLLGVNERKALDALKFGYSTWNSNTSTPQASQFTLWLKQNIANGIPCITAVYLSALDDPEYDHIIPVVGVTFSSLAGYDGNDRLIVNELFSRQVSRQVSSYIATRQQCSYAGDESGCIPRNNDFGVAITGILDAQHVTLPVRLSVANNTEPNVSTGDEPEQMTATVKVSGLQAGREYALLRYDDITGPSDVPTDATASQFLASNFQQRIDFAATDSEWTYQETQPFPSNGTTYYRCVPK